MHLFQPVIALLGFAVMAAGYALPGAYERLYFYYAYRLDHMTSDKPIIAVGCKGKGGGICGLNEFMEYVSKTKVTASITDEILPEIESTAQKILLKEELTSQVELKKVIQNTDGGYAGLLKRIGERFVGKLESQPLDKPPVDAKGKPKAETAEEAVARKANALKEVEGIRVKGYEAMHSVFKARVEAAVEAMKKTHTDLVIVAPPREDGVPIMDFKETAKQSPGGKKASEIKALWGENVRGGHQENISTLNKNVEAAKLKGLCLPGGARRMTKRETLFCGKFSIEDEILFPKEAKLGKAAQMAEQISESEFEALATKKGLKKLAEEKWKGKSLSEVRTMLKYEKLTAESPKVSVGKGGGGFKAPSVASGAVEAIGIGLWVYGIVEAWRENVSGLDRAAAVSAIFPVIGCTVQAFADEAKGAFDTIDTALCLLGDGLMITGNVPLGIAAHVIRAILSFFRPPPYPKLEGMKAARDGIWNRFLKDDIYSYIYSHPNYGTVTGRRQNSAEVEFRDKIEAALAMESLAVISHGAQTIGAAVGSAQDSLEASTTPEQKAEVEKAIDDMKTQLLEATDREIVRRQRQMLIALPKTLKETHDISLQPIADEFNRKFNDNITSSEMVEKYHKWHFMGEGAATEDNQEEVERDLGKIADALYDNPPQLPSYFDLTYILGQSQGLAAIHKDTLSIPSYLRDQFPTMSEASLQVHVLHHTLQIANLIQRKITEDKLSKYFPTADAQGILDLQTLIALKFGRGSDESKLWLAHLQYPEGPWSLMLGPEGERDARIIVNPEIPPAVPLLTGPMAIFLTIGMSKTLVESLSEQEKALTARGVSGVSQAIKELAQKLEANMTAPKRFWPALVAAQKAKDDEDAAFLALPVGPPSEKRSLPRSAAAYRASFAAAAF